MNNRKPIDNTRPADGERRAARGYSAQYRVAAELIYDALLLGDLEWIRVADPEAGRVDDIQIARPGKLDAYQVKWAEFTGNITFHKVVTDKNEASKRTPNLINQLADGWERLSQKYQDRSVYVHLLTNEIASTSDELPVDQTPPRHKHFQAFLRDCWETRHDWVTTDTFESVPTGWKRTVEELRHASGLTDERFTSFLLQCEFDLSYRIYSSSTDTRREADISTIAAKLWDFVAQYKQVVQLKRNDLLRLFGWEKRFEFRFKHEFFVDEVLYQPIMATIEELESTLTACNHGYVAMLGTPGSGKSTTLTQTFRYRPGFRIIRYYAFVRDDTSRGRGEAQNFLHDMVLALRNEGFYGQKRSLGETRQELQDTLGDQFAQLRQDWRENGTRTLIIVDGLDHIEREQSPERSLIEDLPLPNQIPEGVLLVLGSQKLELKGLNPRIKAHLDIDGRTINMKHLSRSAVHTIADSANLPVPLSSENKKDLYRLSDGHPLSLNYLTQKLREAYSEEDISLKLASSRTYSGHIEEDYQVYWQGLKDDEHIRDLLGMLCRLRGPINLELALDWVGDAAIERFIEAAQHYFHKETASRWFFFHNSFRQFLLSATRRNVLGNDDMSKESAYHSRLAEFSSKANTDTPWSWEELYHRAMAGESEEVLKLFTQQFFRRQYFALRSLPDIKDDLSLCFEAARTTEDIQAVIRGFLIEKELRDRDRVLEDIDFIDLLLNLHGPDIAVDTVIRGRELLITENSALAFCSDLMQLGEQRAAKRIFEAAEPLSILTGVEKIETLHGKYDVVAAWVSVAFHFRPLKEVISAIDHVQVTQDQLLGVSIENANAKIRGRLMTTLTDRMYLHGSEDLLHDFEALCPGLSDGRAYLERLDLHRAIDSSTGLIAEEIGVQALARLSHWENEDLHDSDRILLAELVYLLEKNGAKAAALLEKVPQPTVQDWTAKGSSRLKIDDFTDRIRLNRLLSALGTPDDPIKSVPQPEKERNQGTVLFERMVVIAANVWGEAWRNEKMSPDELIRALSPAILLFHRPWQDTKDWYDWHSITSMASQYFDFLLNVADAHGSLARNRLASHIEALWKNEQTSRYWPVERRRRIALKYFELCGDRDGLVRRLTEINIDPSASDTTYDHINEYQQQIYSWLKAGELEQARRLLPKMVKSSFGIDSEKDHQFEEWVKWADRVNSVDPAGMAERMVPFVGTQAILYASNRSDAGEKILELVTKISSNDGLVARKWLLENNGIDFIESLEGVLCGILLKKDLPLSIAIITVSNLIIPFQKSFCEDLATHIRKACRDLEAEEIKHLLSPLVKALPKAYPSVRAQWIKALTPCLMIGKPVESFPSQEEEPGSIKRGLYLLSGEFLSENEARYRAASFNDLNNLLGEVEKSEYVNWEHVLTPLADKLTIDQIHVLDEKLAVIEKGHNYRVVFGRRLFDLGSFAEAKDIINQVISESSPSGWNRWYDGGTRLKAVSYLVEMDEIEGRTLAFDLLVRDYLSESRYPDAMIYSLDEIIPLLYVDPPVLDIWGELQEHIGQLNDFRLSTNLPTLLGGVKKVDSHGVLINLIFQELMSPVFAVRCGARRALANIIIEGSSDDILVLLFSESLAAEDAYQAEILAVLEIISRQRPGFVSRLSTELSGLFLSPCMIAREMAYNIAQIAALGIDEIDMAKEDLSPIYSMKLSPFKMPEQSLYYEDPPPGHIYPDTSDPLEMVRPYQEAFKKLSKVSGIDFENLVTRGSLLMRTIEPEDKWNKLAEKKVSDWLKEIRFTIPYHRLRVAVAQRALSYVVRELIDAAVIEDYDVDDVLEWLIVHDPGLSSLLPEPRPEWILKPSSDQMGDYPRKDWDICSHENLSMVLDRLSDGRLVLGEWSRFVKQDWGQPEEVRCSMLVPSSWPAPDANEVFFLGRASWRAIDYPNLYDFPGPSKFPFLVFKAWGWFTNGDWFALNPSLGYSMGWEVASDGLFRWIDRRGETMVETLWWQDGCLHYYEPHHHNEVCAEGWLVLASEKAASELEKRIPWLVRMSKVSRLGKRSERESDCNIAVSTQQVWLNNK